MDKRHRRPEPRDIQVKRIRRKFGVSEAQARLIAGLCFLGGRNG